MRRCRSGLRERKDRSDYITRDVHPDNGFSLRAQGGGRWDNRSSMLFYRYKEFHDGDRERKIPEDQDLSAIPYIPETFDTSD